MNTLIDDDDDQSGPRPAIVTCRHTELEAATDGELIRLMANKSEEDLAQRACEELHRRHAHFLLAYCFKYRFETFGDGAEVFVNETFFRAYEKAHQCLSRDSTDQVLAWLFQILRSIFYDARDAENRRPLVRRSDDEDEDWLERVPERSEPVLPMIVPEALKAAVRQVREAADQVDRAILDTMAEYWSRVSSETELDPEVRRSLCRHLGLTENSLRVRRCRLKRKIKDLAAQIENQNTQPQRL